MRKVIVVSALILTIAATAAAGSRTLTRAVDARTVETVRLDSGIGDVRVTAVGDLEDLSIEVVLMPRRGGIFSSMRAAEREVEAASLVVEPEAAALHISIDPTGDDARRFEERWTIQMPSRLRLVVDHGVGDIAISGLRSGLELDSGVGDVSVQVSAGDVQIDLGVGTAMVRAPASAVESAEGAGGVGNVDLTVRGERIEGGGFISDAASWEGGGESRIEVSVGVGDVVIELD